MQLIRRDQNLPLVLIILNALLQFYLNYTFIHRCLFAFILIHSGVCISDFTFVGIND